MFFYRVSQQLGKRLAVKFTKYSANLNRQELKGLANETGFILWSSLVSLGRRSKLTKTEQNLKVPLYACIRVINIWLVNIQVRLTVARVGNSHLRSSTLGAAICSHLLYATRNSANRHPDFK